MTDYQPINVIGDTDHGLIVESIASSDGHAPIKVAIETAPITKENRQGYADEYQMLVLLSKLPPEHGGLNFIKPLSHFECVGSSIYSNTIYKQILEAEKKVILPSFCETKTLQYGNITVPSTYLSCTVTEILQSISDVRKEIIAKMNILTDEYKEIAELDWSILLQCLCALHHAYEAHGFIPGGFIEGNSIMLRPYIGKEMFYDIRGRKVAVKMFGYMAVITNNSTVFHSERPPLQGRNYISDGHHNIQANDVISLVTELNLEHTSLMKVFYALHVTRLHDEGGLVIDTSFTPVNMLNYMLDPTAYISNMINIGTSPITLILQ